MDLDRYLARIGYTGPREPGAQTLRQLHRAHLFSVPFENLSIHWGEPIRLDDVAHYWKIVESRRGGFCYELNGLFAWALRELGFEVDLLAASVWSALAPGDGYGPEYSHLLLRVRLAEPWLADVGFGDNFLNPLVLRDGAVAPEVGRSFRLDERDGRWTLRMQGLDGRWVERYRFHAVPRRIEEFAAMCEYHQTSPKSHFTQKTVCSLMRPDGRITLSGQKLLVTHADGTQQQHIMENDQEVRHALLEYFGIMSPGQALPH